VPKTVVIVSSGGDYTQPPLNAMNYVTPYLKTVLGFNGLHEVDIIEAPGMNMGDEKRSQSLQQAEQQIASSLN
jgi:FMN-dependent NADH-azoreductase